jgi:hypothetical protein
MLKDPDLEPCQSLLITGMNLLSHSVEPSHTVVSATLVYRKHANTSEMEPTSTHGVYTNRVRN